ncbi:MULTISPECIES: energy transducer TonB [Agarivorans]|uniref:Protein TonB n=1 Tax=Agarivorans albus MKT 106 TaxID=1331007 RepID=R9PNE1_AGAAL|nr:MULTISPECIES: energy transducer TonB [Agarivorans]GAD02815.1 ferric siderophore transport system [Agarivorans albus MKT 106]
MLRLLLISPLAVLLAISLFVAMNSMVHFQRSLPEDNSAKPNLFIQLQQPESIAQRRQRRLPEPPEPMPEAPSSSATSAPEQASSNDQQLNTLAMPSINFESNVSALSLSAPNLPMVANVQQQDILPLHRIEPKYPERAKRRNIEGYVKFSITINEAGRVTDIKVLDAKPKGVFEREAYKALSRWKYQPQMVNGKATKITDHTVIIDFEVPAADD